MAMIPCESWPARLALTQPMATAFASSCDAPAARRRAVPIFVRRSAWTVGIEDPPDRRPAQQRGERSARERSLALKQRDICNRVQGKLLRRRGTHALRRGLADNR